MKVKALEVYRDVETDKIINIGDEYEVSEERYLYLSGGNPDRVVYVKKIDESDEKIPEEATESEDGNTNPEDGNTNPEEATESENKTSEEEHSDEQNEEKPKRSIRNKR